MTFAELSRYLESELRAIGIVDSEARAESELIIASLSQMSRAQRIKDSELLAGSELLHKCQEIIARRQKREPLQYCLAEAHFYGLRFLLRRNVLIPRADTETLVTAALNYFQPLAKNRAAADPLFVAEIGCGSGIISIAMLKQIEKMNISACDISAEAVEQTRENAQLHELCSRLQLACQDWRIWIKSFEHNLDGLLANPPYIPRALSQSLAPEVAGWEPELALFGEGEDGLNFYRELGELASAAFAPDARVFLEIGQGQANLVADIFCARDWRLSGLEKDLNGIDRVLCLIPPNSPF